MTLCDSNGFGPLFNQSLEKGGLTFYSLGSGSSGNCYLLSTEHDCIILDAGIGLRKTIKHFEALRIDAKKVRAIFITHDHADHTRGAVRLAYKLQVPIYTSPHVARSLLYHRYSTPDLNAYLRVKQIGEAVSIGDFSITTFEVPHDSTNNVGYSITTPFGCFVLITDIGHITPEITTAIARANFLVFESNYDEVMLKTGPYPYHLKQRICSGEGHISNKIAADTLSQNYHKGLQFLALCHISQENNRHELAYSTVRESLQGIGVDCDNQLKLCTLKRYEPEEFILV